MGPRGHKAVRSALLLSLLIVLTMHVSEGKRNNNNNKNQQGADRCKNKRTWVVSMQDLASSPQLTCAQGPVVSAHITALKGKCKGTTGFTRYTALRCMWNVTCYMGHMTHMPLQPRVLDQPLPSAKGRNPQCMGQTPDRLLLGYTCLRKKVAVMDVLGAFQKTRKPYGVVRSHSQFPWGYRNDGVGLGNVTFLRPRKPAGLTKLWISVYFYSIMNKDLVFMSWEDPVPRSRSPPGGRQVSVRGLRQILPNDTTFAVSDVSTEVILTFYVDVNADSSDLQGEDHGFLLCFQWLKPNAKPKKGSACTRLMRPAKCQGKSQNRKGRKGSGRSNRKRARDNKNRASRNRNRNNDGGNNNNNRRGRANNKGDGQQ